MKLKTRLIIGFMTVIILPLFLSFAVITGFWKYQITIIKQNYGVTGDVYETFSNPVNILNAGTEKAYESLVKVARENASQLLDRQFLDGVNERLKEKKSYIIVRDERDTIYMGRTDIGSLLEDLPEYGEMDTSSDNGTYIGGEDQVLIKQIDFKPDGVTKTSIYIVTDVSDILPEVKSFMSEMILAVIVILAFTAGTLIIWIYRGVVVPLSRMKIATQNIKGGNLDYELEIETDDEIGQLCRDFEEMRMRLRETAQEKVEYDRRNKELISNISHDLKTPITAIKGYVEGIMDGVADTPEKMERYIKTIYNKANEMDSLINELTLYSKIDANRIPYNFNTVYVNDYFEDCADELRVDLESRGVEFGYFNYVDSKERIIADVEQLKRVINNIASNSVKYMDKPQKLINLRVKDVGDFIQVEIEDNGRGIGPKELPHIFERFYRTDSSRNSSTGGSGIGLSIVKKIVEEHGGKIWATSREGTGTVMYFVIRKYQEVSSDE